MRKSDREKYQMSQRLMAELLGISKFDLGMHERHVRPLPPEADHKMTEFRLRMLDFDPEAALKSDPELKRMQIQALEKQYLSLTREVASLYSKLTQLEKEQATRMERLRWAEGFIRTMQFMMDKGYNDYTNSILVQMEYLTAMKWYAENSPALLDCLQSEIDAVRMRYEMRNVVWEKIKNQMVDLGNPTDYRS